VSEPFVIGSGLGVVIAALAVLYAQYRGARPDSRRSAFWDRLATLSHSPLRAIAYVIAYAMGWVVALLIVDRLALGSLPRDAQASLLLLLLTSAVLTLGIFVVWSRSPVRR
jgi:drug/metabolite transporter (DMT)-like permease